MEKKEYKHSRTDDYDDDHGMQKDMKQGSSDDVEFPRAKMDPPEGYSRGEASSTSGGAALTEVEGEMVADRTSKPKVRPVDVISGEGDVTLSRAKRARETPAVCEGPMNIPRSRTSSGMTVAEGGGEALASPTSENDDGKSPPLKRSGGLMTEEQSKMISEESRVFRGDDAGAVASAARTWLNGIDRIRRGTASMRESNSIRMKIYSLLVGGAISNLMERLACEESRGDALADEEESLRDKVDTLEAEVRRLRGELEKSSSALAYLRRRAVPPEIPESSLEGSGGDIEEVRAPECVVAVGDSVPLTSTRGEEVRPTPTPEGGLVEVVNKLVIRLEALEGKVLSGATNQGETVSTYAAKAARPPPRITPRVVGGATGVDTTEKTTRTVPSSLPTETSAPGTRARRGRRRGRGIRGARNEDDDARPVDGGRRDPGPCSDPSRGEQEQVSRKKRGPAAGIWLPTSAAVLVLAEDRRMHGGLLSEARSSIKLEDLGVRTVRSRLTRAGDILLEVPDGDAAADRLAESLRLLFGGRNGIQVMRPQSRLDVWVGGCEMYATPEAVATAVATAGGCAEGSVRITPAGVTRSGRTAFWAPCPASAAMRVAKSGSINMGWEKARVEISKERPLLRGSFPQRGTRLGGAGGGGRGPKTADLTLPGGQPGGGGITTRQTDGVSSTETWQGWVRK